MKSIIIGIMTAAVLTATGMIAPDNIAPDNTVNETEENKLTDTNLSYKMNSCMDPNTNYVFSPFSLKSALALTANGADGQTRDDILYFLGYEDIETLNEDMAELTEKYNSDGKIKLSAANSIWVNKTCPKLSDNFKKAASNIGAETFRESVSAIERKSKKWIQKKSNGLQKDVCLSTDDGFVMGIVNTTYMKAKWRSPFEKNRTYDRNFYNANGTVAETSFMSDTSHKKVYTDNNITMVKLDYLDGEKNMSFYAAMCDPNIDPVQYIDKLSSQRVFLSIPRFKHHSNIELNDTIKAGGAGSIFSSNADFGNIFKEECAVFITCIVQDTVIDVDEEGTEAASTTLEMMVGSALQEPPLEITFDRPFTYFIMDNENGEILFMGRYANS